MVLSVIALTVLMAAFIGGEIYFGNMHSVVRGELYRSAQLQPGDLTRYTHRYHIASVLNLRGADAGRVWYDDEVRESASLGIKHIDFPMNASAELTDQQARQLIAIMRDAPKPLLIHCRSGADRTGLASALYVAAIAKQGEWSAEEQLWLNYGHVPVIGAAVAMNRTFERLEPVLGFPHS